MCRAPGSEPEAPGTELGTIGSRIGGTGSERVSNRGAHGSKRGGPEQVLVETGEVSGPDARRALRRIS